MISYRHNNNALNVLVSQDEKINITKVKHLIKKGRRVIQQNNVNTLTIELKKVNKINTNAFTLFNKAVTCSTNFPITISYT